VVGVALVASWLVAAPFTCYPTYRLVPRRDRGGETRDEQAIYSTRFCRGFRRTLEFCVARPLVMVAAAVAALALGLFQFGQVQQQAFPRSERPELFLEMRLTQGSAIQASKKVAAEAEQLLAEDPDIASYTTYIGRSSARFWLGLLPVQPNEALAQIVVVAKDVDARERVKAHIEAAVAGGALSAARVRVDRFNCGPAVSFPVQFRVVGAANRQSTRHRRAHPRHHARRRAGVDPHLNWGEKMPSLRREIDQARARALGLTPQGIAQTLQILIGRATVATIRAGEERVDVGARAALDRLEDLTVVAHDGVAVPVREIARVDGADENPIIWRRDRRVVMIAQGDAAPDAQAPDLSNALWSKIGSVRASPPPSYRLEMGGTIEETQKGNSSIYVLFPLIAVAMPTFLMLRLEGFSRLAIVFSTAPLGVIGASIALNLAHKPFGFVALLGLISLAGMACATASFWLT
jgi:multidrug efflux pump